MSSQLGSRRRLAILAGLAVTTTVVGTSLASGATAASQFPADGPRLGCNTISDPKGDSTEPGSDMTGLVMRSTPTSLIGYIRLVSLSKSGSGPLDDGNHFSWGLRLNGHELVFDAAQTGAVSGLVRGVLGNPDTVGRMDGADRSELKVEAKFDTKTNIVAIAVEKAGLAKITKASLDDGTSLEFLHAEAGPLLLVGLGQTDDQITAEQYPSEPIYLIGHNVCFGPAPAIIDITGALKAPSQTVAQLAARVVNTDGTPQAGREVQFTIDTLKATGTTDSFGVARASLAIPMEVGYYSLRTYFAGDDTANEALDVSQFFVDFRKTHLAMSYRDVKNGREFTATLLDASNQGIGGQDVTWSVKGVNKVTSKTNGAGKSVYLDRTLSRQVGVTFAGAPNRVAGCSAEFKY